MKRGPVLSHALVPPAGPEDDGVVGEQHENQEHAVEPARPPLTMARAREMTAGLREAMDDVRRSVAVLAARVRDAQVARVWLPLGHSNWEPYCGAEFGISRAQAYRLLDVARSLTTLHETVAAGTGMSRTRDTAAAAGIPVPPIVDRRAVHPVVDRQAPLRPSGSESAPYSSSPTGTPGPPRSDGNFPAASCPAGPHVHRLHARRGRT